MYKITIEADEGTEVVELSAEQQKAWRYRTGDLLWHTKKFIRSQVRRGMEVIVQKSDTDKDPKKISDEDGMDIVAFADVLSAKERQEELEAELEKN